MSAYRARETRRDFPFLHSPWLESVDTDAVLSKLGGKTLDHVGGSSLAGVVEDLRQRVVQSLLVVELYEGRQCKERVSATVPSCCNMRS